MSGRTERPPAEAGTGPERMAMQHLAQMAKVISLRGGALPLMVACALLLSACAMKAYRGPQLPKSEIAVVHKKNWRGQSLGFLFMVPYPLYKHRASVYEINGRRGLGSPIHIRPGRHTAKVRYEKSPRVAFCGIYPPISGCVGSYTKRNLSIVFVAEAGHEYRIPAERRHKRTWIWVVDITSGKVVAGEKPPALPPAPPPATQTSRL